MRFICHKSVIFLSYSLSQRATLGTVLPNAITRWCNGEYNVTEAEGDTVMNVVGTDLGGTNLRAALLYDALGKDLAGGTPG